MDSVYFMLVLHAHIPYVIGTSVEYWLHEAVLHTYLPFLEMLNRCFREKIPTRVTLNISPILINQLARSDFPEKFLEYVGEREKNLNLPVQNQEIGKILQIDRQKLHNLKALFLNEWNRDIVAQFRKFQELGIINILTSAATHAYLPLWEFYGNSVNCQIDIGRKISSACFKNLDGFWSPECGVFPDLPGVLKEFGFSYFFVDSSAVNTKHVFQPFANCGVSYFVRDVDTSMKVWDPNRGYPGHPVYRDFYSDFSLDPESYNCIRERAGFSIRSVTDKQSNVKKIYCHASAERQAKLDAEDFCAHLLQKFKNLSGNCCSVFFDAELFGHWWCEGINFLYYLFCVLSRQNFIQPVFPEEILQKTVPVEFLPMYSSWGANQDASSWLNAKTYIFLEKIYNVEPNVCSIRNFLLSQASDWMFLITYNSFSEFSKNHLSNLLSSNCDSCKENDLLQQCIETSQWEDFFAI